MIYYFYILYIFFKKKRQFFNKLTVHIQQMEFSIAITGPKCESVDILNCLKQILEPLQNAKALTFLPLLDSSYS